MIAADIPAGALRKNFDHILERRGCSRRDLKLNYRPLASLVTLLGLRSR